MPIIMADLSLMSLFTLPELGLLALELDFKTARKPDQYGNIFRYRARVSDKQKTQIGRWA